MNALATSDPVAEDPRDAIMSHLGPLRAFAISLTRDRVLADDLLQDTVLKAWTNFDKFQQGTNLRAWLFTILRNQFYSHKRKAVREVGDPEGVIIGAQSEPPTHDGKLAFGDFRRAFDQLSPEHREVLILVGAQGYSYEDAAEMMGVAVGTAKSRASRARLRLCELMGVDPSDGSYAVSSGLDMAALQGDVRPRG